MSINPEGAKILFSFELFGMQMNVTMTLISVALVTLILCVAGVLLGKNLKKRPGGLQVLTEKGVSVLYDLVSATMGEHNAHWTPFIGTIFLSSILGSYLGMTGFLPSSTADLSVVLTWAVVVSVLIWYHSIRENGFFGWLKGFTEPIVVMTPMNLISEVAQPVSMAFRHFGNVAGGGVITAVMYQAMALASTALLKLLSSSGIILSAAVLAAGIAIFLLAVFRFRHKLRWKILAVILFVLGLFSLLEAAGVLTGVPLLQVGLPAVLSLYFDVFSGLIQAFVFSLLTMIYISGACPPPEDAAEKAQ